MPCHVTGGNCLVFSNIIMYNYLNLRRHVNNVNLCYIVNIRVNIFKPEVVKELLTQLDSLSTGLKFRGRSLLFIHLSVLHNSTIN